METVKEFKDAGLVISEKDMIDGVTGDAGSQAISIGDATINGELPIHNAWIVREFAWRENTGEKPAFSGGIKVRRRDRSLIVVPKDYKWDLFGVSSDIISWTPLLNQSTLIETPEEKEALDKIFGADSAPKPSKTVWDAVNELRGDLSNVNLGLRVNDVNLWFNNVKNNYLSLTGKPFASPEIYELTCTVAEFNALVEEMTLGLDVNSVTHGRYLHYICADKVLLKKEVKPLVYTQGMVDDGCQVEFGTWSYTESGQCLVADKSLLKKGSTVNKPLIYTQEMYDNGELPSVGMLFMHQGNLAVTISTSKEHNGVITFTTDDGCSIDCCWFNDAWVNPIDTRTKKEKAIDEIFNNRVWDNNIELLGSAYDEWVGE